MSIYRNDAPATPPPLRARGRRINPAPSFPRRVRPVTVRGMGRMGDNVYSTIDPRTGARVSYDMPGQQGSTTRSYPPEPLVPPPSARAAYPDGTLVRAEGTAPISIMVNGMRSWIPNVETLTAMGFTGDDLTKYMKVISVAAYGAIPEGPPIPDVRTQTPAPTSSTTVPAGSSSATIQQPVPAYSTGGNYQSTGTPASTVSPSSTFSLGSPSSWPSWMWLTAIGTGLAALTFVKHK